MHKLMTMVALLAVILTAYYLDDLISGQELFMTFFFIVGMYLVWILVLA